MTKWVYSFGDGRAEGSRDMSALLGGKGANLAEMTLIGLPVPPGFTISTRLCDHYLANHSEFSPEVEKQVGSALAGIATIVGKKFGDPVNPLLVSVRSGASASMPGMMDTVLNLGLNDQNVETLAARSGDRRFAYDTYRRFVQMYAEVVLGVDPTRFEEIIDETRARRDAGFDADLSADDWQKAIANFQQAILEDSGKEFPQDVTNQLWGAIGAVFKSWQNPRAVTYRTLHNISHNAGTAVTIQAMVFGNMGESSASGVAFTRNPATGENNIFGEYLLNAQGEDVVAGIRTPSFVTERARMAAGSDDPSLEKTMPAIFDNLAQMLHQLEQHYHDMQDVEFTIEASKLWLLQTRKGKRTTKAAVKIAVQMVDEGLIDRQQAIDRIDRQAIDRLVNKIVDPRVDQDIFTRGLPASPGAACGAIVFSTDEAIAARAEGKKIILVRKETSPHDIGGMNAAEAILTSGGGMTSHAAVVARSMGKPCVCGAMGMRINIEAGEISSSGRKLQVGDMITLDGTNGTVLMGILPLVEPKPTGDLAKIVAWAST